MAVSGANGIQNPLIIGVNGIIAVSDGGSYAWPGPLVGDDSLTITPPTGQRLKIHYIQFFSNCTVATTGLHTPCAIYYGSTPTNMWAGQPANIDGGTAKALFDFLKNPLVLGVDEALTISQCSWDTTENGTLSWNVYVIYEIIGIPTPP